MPLRALLFSSDCTLKCIPLYNMSLCIYPTLSKKKQCLPVALIGGDIVISEVWNDEK